MTDPKFVLKPLSPSLATPTLIKGAKSIALTMSAGVGSVPLSIDVTRIGVYPAAAATARIGIDIAPAAIGTATGAAASSDLTDGVPVPAAAWSWFDIGQGEARTLRILAGAAEVVTVVVM